MRRSPPTVGARDRRPEWKAKQGFHGRAAEALATGQLRQTLDLVEVLTDGRRPPVVRSDGFSANSCFEQNKKGRTRRRRKQKADFRLRK